MTSNEPSFKIGEIPIYGDLILAPMEGISDAPFRALTRHLGSALSVSEFINTLNLSHSKISVQNRLVFQDSERPFSIQLLDNDPVRMVEIAKMLYDTLQPDIFDVNMGCSSKNVNSRGAGAGLMRMPKLVARIFQGLSHTFDIPITGKLRLGDNEDNLNYMEITHIIEENGGKMLALHGRTRQQAFKGQARWEQIAEVKAAVNIPVIGNGDVRSVADIASIKAQTGCDAVMIGRHAVQNPWIFSRLDRHEVQPQTVHALMRTQLQEMLAVHYEKGLRLFRKFARAYLSPYKLPRPVLVDLLTCEVVEEFTEQLDRIFNSL